MKHLRRSRADLDSEVSAMGYTPGCWKHGSRPDIPARPGSRSPNGLRLAVAYALDGTGRPKSGPVGGLDGFAGRGLPPKGVGAAYGPPAPIPAACLSPACRLPPVSRQPAPCRWT